MLLKDFNGEVIDLIVSKIFNFLLHNSDNSLFLDADDITDNDLLHGKSLLKFFSFLDGLTLTNLALKFFLFFEFTLLLFTNHALLSQFKYGLLHFLSEFLNFVLPYVPDIVLSIFDIVVSFVSDVCFIKLSFAFVGNGDTNEEFMELFSGVYLMGLIFEDDDSLTFVKGEVESFLTMSQDQDTLNLFKGKRNQSFEGRNANSLIDFSN